MNQDRVLQDINRFESKRLARLFLQISTGLLAGTLLAFPILSLAEFLFYLSPLAKF